MANKLVRHKARPMSDLFMMCDGLDAAFEQCGA